MDSSVSWCDGSDGKRQRCENRLHTGVCDNVSNCSMSVVMSDGKLSYACMSAVQVDKVTKEQRWQNVTIKQ